MSDNIYLILVQEEKVQPFQLIFATQTTARAAYKKIKWESRGEDDFEVEISDDFGQTVLINRDQLVYALMQELGALHRGQAEISLAQARANSTLQRKAAQDPTLKFLTPGVQGMARSS